MLLYWLMVCPAHTTGFSVELDSASIEPDSPLVVHLVAVNPGVDPINITFPATFSGTLTGSNRMTELTFKPLEPGQGDTFQIDSGSFQRITYAATPPEDRPAGTAILKLSLSGSPSFELSPLGTRPDIGDEATPPGRFSLRSAKVEGSTELNFFQRHMFPYEPMYFIAGPDSPTAKFQVSFKYRLINTETNSNGDAEGWLYEVAPWTEGFYFAYNQLSLWDLAGDSSPFEDSNYMPEFFYEQPGLISPESGWLDHAGFRVGIHHESNGLGGADSRSLNTVFLDLPVVLGDPTDFHVKLQPRGWVYVADLSDNPDIAFYRGYVDLKSTIGWADGLQLATHLRAGEEFNRGSVQLDLTYPMHNLLSSSFSFYLQAQYFNGYGESLLSYNQRTESWRVGIGLFR